MELKFNNLTDLLLTFNTEEKAKAYFEQQRWKGKITCPHCGNAQKNYRTNRGFKCSAKTCHKKFTVTVGTVFENTNIKLQKWFAAIYLFTAHKKGVSSCQLARDLGITQKSAWFMLHRIREMFTIKQGGKLSGEVEIDETLIGANRTNLTKSKRKEAFEKYGTGHADKKKVVAMVERGKGVLSFVVPNVKRETVLPLLRLRLDKDATIYTDASHLYTPLSKEFKHETVSHANLEYVRANIHTNSAEGFFSQMKRGIYGIYHQVSEKHLQAYCNEFSHRHNTRQTTDAYRFEKSLTKTEGRLTYNQLISA